jgi:hypothetical protein
MLTMVARAAESAIAVSPGKLPIPVDWPLSANKDVIRALPTPIDVLCVTTPAGAVHFVVADDLSAQ